MSEQDVIFEGNSGKISLGRLDERVIPYIAFVSGIYKTDSDRPAGQIRSKNKKQESFYVRMLGRSR